MAQLLHYAANDVVPERRLPVGVWRSVIAVISAALVLYLAQDARISMAMWRGDWCGNAVLRAEDRLYTTGWLLAVPAAAFWSARDLQWPKAVCRTSALTAALGWLVCVASTRVGLPW